MIKVKDFSKDIFPIGFIDKLPKLCESCGSDIEISETLTYIQCSNRRCSSKVEYRLYLLLQDIGITDLAIDDCRTFLKKNKTNNPYILFFYNPSVDGVFLDGYTIEQSNQIYRKINQRRGMLLWEFIKIGNFPQISESAEKVFSGYKDLRGFYNDLTREGVGLIQRKLMGNLGVETKEGLLIKALLIYETLIYFKEDLEEGIRGVVIIEPSNPIGVHFASEVEGYVSKKEFILEMNKHYHKKGVYLYQSSSLEDTNLLYWEEPKNRKGTSKLREVRENYKHIKVVDLNSIYEAIDNLL